MKRTTAQIQSSKCEFFFTLLVKDASNDFFSEFSVGKKIDAQYFVSTIVENTELMSDGRIAQWTDEKITIDEKNKLNSIFMILFETELFKKKNRERIRFRIKTELIRV